jgi:hypothetical protein
VEAHAGLVSGGGDAPARRYVEPDPVVIAARQAVNTGS